MKKRIITAMCTCAFASVIALTGCGSDELVMDMIMQESAEINARQEEEWDDEADDDGDYQWDDTDSVTETTTEAATEKATEAATEKATEAATEKTTEVVAENFEKDISYPENLVVDYEEYSYDIYTHVQEGHYQWRFPYINYDSKVCEEVNNEIKDFAELNYSDTMTFEDDTGEHTWLKCNDGASYSWGRCGDVLSLFVYGAGLYGEDVEYVYNYYINLKTDALLDKEEFVRYVTDLGIVTDTGASIDYEEYKEHIRESIEKGLRMDNYINDDGNASWTGEKNELTLSQSNVDASYAYIDGTEFKVCYKRYEPESFSYSAGYSYQTYWDTGMYVSGD